jgi:hypothetical protein
MDTKRTAERTGVGIVFPTIVPSPRPPVGFASQQNAALSMLTPHVVKVPTVIA